MKTRPHYGPWRDLTEPVDDAQMKAQLFSLEEEEKEEEARSSFSRPCPDRHKERRPSYLSPENHISFALTRPALTSLQPGPSASGSVTRAPENRRPFEHTMVNGSETSRRVSHRVPATSGVPRCCESSEVLCPESEAAAAAVCGEMQRPEIEGDAHSINAVGAAPHGFSEPPPAVSSSIETPGLSSRSLMTQKYTRNSRTSPSDLRPRLRALLPWLLLAVMSVGVRASEFPDRECCDSAPPPPPQYHTTTSTSPVPLLRFTSSSTTTTPPTPPSLFPISSVPPTGEGAVGVRNCLLARQLCTEDLSCRSVLEIIPRVCGPESVACSTVTVNKCLAALRTIQGFPYFQPTCLCREPHLDRECNVFREFIFDHPCSFVENKDTSPYAVHALPLCEYALNACEQLPGCIKLYEEFREACRVRDDQCRMTDPNKCLSSWTKLKMSPMFGCICPMDRQKKKCERIFRRVHSNPCVGHTSSPSGPMPVLHSTCQTALKACNAEPVCRRLLDPVLAMCDNECNREACMSNLQTFYRNVESKWALEVAFCLCKNRSVTASECLTAQEKLHPKCAIHPPGPALMLCNRLAAACKEASSCRHRLEFYEQACAVDSDTRRCAGSTAECRRAVLGILGTELRTLCTCAASDPRETYTCFDWHRILWFNPCVVESQMNYHREMIKELGAGEKVTTSASIVYTTTITTGIIITPEDVLATLTTNGAYSFSPILEPSATTTTTIPTTTLPPKYCEKRHANDDTIDYIKEGWGKRFYKNKECSELCLCHAEEKLACSVLGCVEARPCKTNYAVYTHAAPAYQASRGECFCYSGSFICVRPPQDEYSVNSGVFLFIGYSEAEEYLLRPYTKINLVDAAMNKLGELVHESAQLMNGRDRRVSSPDFHYTKSECHLEVVSHIGENIILQATLEEFEDSRDNMSAPMLQEEKEACEKVVTEVGQKINSHAKEVREDMALSVLILAEVQVHVPPVPDASTLAQCPTLLLLLLLAALPSLQQILLAS